MTFATMAEEAIIASQRLPMLTLQAQLLRQCVDLTSLERSTTNIEIENLCQKAIDKQVAAVCIYPEFLEIAKHFLADSSIQIATVANFPEGNASWYALEKELDEILAVSIGEIDLVFPYPFYLDGEKKKAFALVEKIRDFLPDHYILKVILETGALNKLEDVVTISDTLLTIGADFLKTSTGKISVGAELPKAFLMLHSLKNFALKTGKRKGFKVSGGIRTPEIAAQYVCLARYLMDDTYITPSTFRIGASQLVENL